MQKDKTSLKLRFKKGMRPTEQDFADFIDSCVNPSDDPYTKPDGSVPFTGTVGGITPIQSSHLATKGYVDDQISDVPSRDGTRGFSATVSAPTPTADSHLANKAYVDGRDNQLIAMDGSRSFTGNVGGVTPSQPAHLATKGYVDGSIALTVLADGSRAFSAPVSGANPTSPAHLATKYYVDSAVQGMVVKDSVRAATTGSIVLSGTDKVVDGITCVAGDRVLVKNQANATQNGIYVVSASAWARATDADNIGGGAEVRQGLSVVVGEGSSYAGTMFWITSPNTSDYTVNNIPAIQLGTSSIAFSQLSGINQLTVTTGLTKEGNNVFLTDTGVSPGAYNNVTIDAQGRVTSAQSVGYITNNQQINVTGDVSGTGTTSLALTLSDTCSGGTYTKLTVDSKGRATGGTTLSASDIPSLDWGKITTSKPTTLAGYGITDAAPKTHSDDTSGNTHGATDQSTLNAIVRRDSNGRFSAAGMTGNLTGNADTASKLFSSRTIGLSGDATGSTSFDGSAGATISTLLSNTGVTPGTYTKLTVDSKGRVTSAENTGSSDAGTFGTMTVNGHILPGTINLTIGSVTNRFKSIYVDEVYLSANTLWLGDTPVIGTDADTIIVKGDTDQTLLLKTTGLGDTKMSSENNVEVTSTGVNCLTKMQATGANSRAIVAAPFGIDLNSADTNVSGRLNVTGTATFGANVTFSGSNTIVNATTVETADNTILLNKGEVGAGVTAGTAGFQIDRGSLADVTFIWDETADKFKMGPAGSEVNIATEAYADSVASSKANSANAALTGVPTAPTAGTDTNNTQVATTAFVIGQLSGSIPLVDGTASSGSSTRAAKGDHVHPTDTSRQATITGAASTVASFNLNAGTVVITDAGGKLTHSTLAASKLTYLSNVTSDIQTQLGEKDSSGTAASLVGSHNTTTGVHGVLSQVVGISDGQVLTNKQIDSSQLTGTINASRLPAMSGDVTSSQGSNTLTLNTVVTAGTYFKTTVDSKGRVTTGQNPTTLSGFGITDAVNKGGDTMTGFLVLSADPTSDMHAATKRYVDTVALGLDVKAACRAASTGNIDLGIGGLFELDGVTLVADDRVLVKNQLSASQNGIYVAKASSWVRATDADVTGEIDNGVFVFVTAGTINANNGWIVTTPNPISIGSTPITWNQFSGAAEVDAGTGIFKSGNTISLTDVGTAGTYYKVTTDSQGRITGGAVSLTAGDIPVLNWSKITTGLPTTLVGYGITDAVPSSDLSTYAAPNKVLRLDSTSKLPANITGNADGNAATATNVAWSGVTGRSTTLAGYGITDAVSSSHVGATGAAHGNAGASAGFMSAADKTKLDSIASGAQTNQNVYANVSVSGQSNMPAISTSDALTFEAGSNITLTTDPATRKLTIAAATSIAWANITSKPTTISGYGINDAAPLSHVGAGGTAHSVSTTSVSGFMSASDKTKLDGMTPDVTASANSIVKRDPWGYINAVYFTMTSPVDNNAASSYFYETGSDGFIRRKSLANTKAEIVTKAAVEASLTGAITSHSHDMSWSAVTSKPTTVAGYGITDSIAMLASPTFTGTPAAPTATAGTNTTQLATTAFVTGAITTLVGGAGAALDTLNELAVALGNDPNFATTIATSIATKVTSNAGIIAGTGTKVTYDTKGLVTSSTALAAGDIPSLDWGKITSGKPTTLVGYGITDASASTHNHDSAYLKLVGGSVSGQITSTVSTGTSPLVVASTTLVTNLNADTIDGNHASAFATASHNQDWSTITTGRPITLAGYGITDAAAASHVHSWANITSDKPTTVAGYGITDAITTGNIGSQSVNYAATAGSITFASVTSKPTTLAGYGITDASISSHTHSYLPLAGGTVSGQIASTVPTSTPPFAVVSTTLVTNLNADTVDGNHASAFATASHNQDWSTITSGKPTTLAGYGITDASISSHTHSYLPLAGGSVSGQITSTVSTGTAPLIVASTTLVSNFNADTIDGNHASAFAAASHNQDWSTITTGKPTTVAGYGITDASVSSHTHPYAPLAGATFTGLVTLAADPSGSMHAATKQYVDSVAAGLDPKQSCRVGSTGLVTISSPGASIDGITLNNGDRVLLKNQSTLSENGVYVFNGAASAMTRATDFDSSADVTNGAFVFIANGTNNGGSGWVVTTPDPITVGATSITLVQFSGGGSLSSGTGISINGNQVSITNVGTTGTYTKVTTDAQGRVTSGTTLSASDIPSLDWTKITTSKPTTVAGYGITDAITTGNIASQSVASAAAVAWSGVSAKPTTVAGFGITDAITTGNIASQSVASAAAVAWSGVSSKPTTLAGYGITDASISSHTHSYLPLAGGSVSGQITSTVVTGTAPLIVASTTLVLNLNADTIDGNHASAFAAASHNQDWSTITTGKPTTVAGYGITDAITTGNIASQSVASAAAVAWSGVSSKPTTLSGYGITDAVGSSHIGSGGAAHAAATTLVNGFMSSTDKTKLDGMTPDTAASANSVVKRDASGYVNAGFFNMTGIVDNFTATSYIYEQASDGYLRRKTLANVKAEIVTKAAVEASLTGGITSHTHTFASETSKPTTLAGYGITDAATLASPALTGVPSAPTATAGTNTTQIATTAFVSTAVSDLVAAAPATLNTLNELATALANDPNFATTMTTSIATKVAANIAITAGTNCKITYDAKGLVTAGAALAAGDIPSHNQDWSTIATGKPTTLAGYGITDASISSHTHSYLPLAGGSVSGQITSTVVTGTAPLIVASTTLVTNLNADTVDGNHASAFATASHNQDWSTITTGKPTTIAGYGITDAITTANIGSQSVNYAATAPWSGISTKPTTLAGYGITDAAASSHNHDASNVTTGVLNTARLGSGTANSTVYLQGNSTWAAIPFSSISSPPTTLSGYGLSGDAYTKTETDNKYKYTSIQMVIGSGSAVVSAGVAGYLEVPFNCTIDRWTILANPSGSAVIDVWKCAYASALPTVANTITASAKPALTSAVKGQSTTLTGWTTTLTAGDIIAFNVDSASTVTQLTISLRAYRT